MVTHTRTFQVLLDKNILFLTLLILDLGIAAILDSSEMVPEYIESGCDISSDVMQCYSYDFSANDNEEYYYYETEYYDYNNDYYEDNEEYYYYDYNSTYDYYEDNEEYYYYDETEYCHDKRSALRMAVSWNSTNFIRSLIEVYL